MKQILLYIIQHLKITVQVQLFKIEFQFLLSCMQTNTYIMPVYTQIIMYYIYQFFDY